MAPTVFERPRQTAVAFLGRYLRSGGPRIHTGRRLTPCVCGALLVCQVATASAQATLERFTVTADGHPLAVWARVPSAPRAAVLLLHGRTWSSRPDWDLDVPGLEQSVLRSLAVQGIAAYAVDLRGYGETPRDSTGWNTPIRSANDVARVLAWIRVRHAALGLPALVGWSRGGAIAMLVAQSSPTLLSRLVLFGFSWDPDVPFAALDDPKGRPAAVPNTAAAAASDFVSPRVTSPAVIRAFVEQALRADPVFVDAKADREFAGLAASRVPVPTLVVFGSRDPAFNQAGAKRFVAALAHSTRRLLVLPGADHAAHLEDTHDAWVKAVVSFVGGER